MTMSKTAITDRNIFEQGALDSIGGEKVGEFTIPETGHLLYISE